jgi:hypothetical protein
VVTLINILIYQYNNIIKMMSEDVDVPSYKYIADINEFYKKRPQHMCSIPGKDYVSKYAFLYTDIKNQPTYFQKDYPITVVAPWKGVMAEKTFLNEIKRNNEPPVKTYRDIMLLDVPPVVYSSEPVDFGVEYFEGKQYKEKGFICLFMIFVMLILLWSVAEYN